MAEEVKEVKKVKRPTALKRDIQSKKRRMRNRTFASSIKTVMRHLDETLEKGDQAKAKEFLNEAYSMVDKAVQRGLYKGNKASRTKSRLSARVAAL